MKAYTVSQLARLASVSMRTLHHYDQIGLLKPSDRTAAGYRLYQEQDLRTVDKTIQRLTEDTMSVTDEELYEGFSTEQIDRYKREARQMYDPALVAESERRVGRMSKAQWQAVKAEGGAVMTALGALIDRDPADPEVQALIARHYAWINNFYTPTAEVYRGLGQLYVEHPEFRATHERIRPGLAEFMAAAMAHYADTALANK